MGAKILNYLLIRLATPALIPLSAIIKQPPTTTISIVNITPWLIDIELGSKGNKSESKFDRATDRKGKQIIARIVESVA